MQIVYELKTKGLDELEQKLATIPDKMKAARKLDKAIAEACGVLQDAAVANAPQVTGILHASSEVEIKSLKGYIGFKAPHAWLVENGHRMYGHTKPGEGEGRKGTRGKQSTTTPRVAGRAFFRKAVDEYAERTVDEITERMKAEIEKMTK